MELVFPIKRNKPFLILALYSFFFPIKGYKPLLQRMTYASTALPQRTNHRSCNPFMECFHPNTTPGCVHFITLFNQTRFRGHQISRQNPRKVSKWIATGNRSWNRFPNLNIIHHPPHTMKRWESLQIFQPKTVGGTVLQYGQFFFLHAAVLTGRKKMWATCQERILNLEHTRPCKGREAPVNTERGLQKLSYKLLYRRYVRPYSLFYVCSCFFSGWACTTWWSCQKSIVRIHFYSTYTLVGFFSSFPSMQ